MFPNPQPTIALLADEPPGEYRCRLLEREEKVERDGLYYVVATLYVENLGQRVFRMMLPCSATTENIAAAADQAVKAFDDACPDMIVEIVEHGELNNKNVKLIFFRRAQ